MGRYSRNEVCPKCRAVYEVIIKQPRPPVQDYFDCVVCGCRLWVWQPSHYPEFHFIKSGQKPPNGEPIPATPASSPNS